jgi:PKD repeat protein
MHARMSLSRLALALVALAATALGGCTVDETEIPPLSGPSELGLSLQMTATPDILPQDGSSQSAVQIVARGPDGRAVRALSLRMEIAVGGIVQDFGTLSSRTVVTGDDGIARLTYTAAPRSGDPSYAGSDIQLRATPISTDYAGTTSREITMRLTPPGVILPPNGAPVPEFTWSPAEVTLNADTIFDASATTDEGRACGNCTYNWTMGDGTSKSGQVITHFYRTAGTFTVRLTVTDPGGQTASKAQAVTVAAGQAPTAAFTFSPTEARASRDIFFNATASTAAPGRRIVFYEWDFGSGRTAEGVTVAKRYDTPGSYVVTLKVTDDIGATATVSQTVSVVP